MSGVHEIRDPLHNFISFNDLEKAVIDSRPFQRLKRIKQLATTHYVYPGAMHTRFEHALGTMHLASVAFDTLMAKDESRFMASMGWSTRSEAERARQILRLGALLHDVGHSAFSHAPEELFGEGQQHEHLTKRLIESPELSSILAASAPFSIPVEDVVYVAVGPKLQGYPKDVGIRFLGELVFGDFGVDRIDYLNRDSLHLGVQYGRFDFARLINTLTYTKSRPSEPDDAEGDPVLAIEAGGVHSAEGLYLARYFMFLQVYFHHVRSIYDLHLTDFIEAFLHERGFNGLFPTELDDYLSLSDLDFEESIQSSTGELGRLARPLKYREHFRLVRDVVPSELAGKGPDFQEELEQKVQDQFGAQVKMGTPEKSSYSIRLGDMLVVDDDRTVDILARSELIEHLPRISRLRIYAQQEKLDEVKKFVSNLLEAKHD